MNLKERAKGLKNEITAIYIALMKKETPLSAKVMAMITITYALSPIDLIPDFIPVLGYLDDVILLPIFISITIKLIPEHIYMEAKEEAKRLNRKDLKKWYYAIPIIIIWVLALYFIYTLFIFSTNYFNWL